MNSIYVNDLPKTTPNLTGYTLYNDGSTTTLSLVSDLKTVLGLSNTNSGDDALHNLLVPYTGSTQDVNLGDYGLKAGSLTVDLGSNRKTGLVNDDGLSNLYSETSMNINGSEGASINTGENGYIDLLIAGEDRLNIRDTVIIAQVPIIAVHGITGTTFRTPSGTTTQFLKADGSVDNNEYLPLIGTNYILVKGKGTPTENAAELQEAYNEAKKMPRYLGDIAVGYTGEFYTGQSFYYNSDIYAIALKQFNNMDYGYYRY